MGYTKCIISGIVLCITFTACKSKSLTLKKVQEQEQVENKNTNNRNTLIGQWVCKESALYRNTKFSKLEINEVINSKIIFTEKSVYFEDFSNIDTCYYSDIHYSKYFDGRSPKESSYIMDGPLAVKYYDKELKKIEKLNLIGPEDYSCLRELYLNRDTLIINHCGGVTLYYVKE